ncbi:MAG: ATP-dependent DNA helicase RecQ [bacterium]|jgi:ATP-dependent DNA helicase RecQ
MTPLEVLRQHWGHEEFRPLQQEIISSVLNKKDTLAILPTGGGKSVCFQVPGLLLEGCCLVISPLIALMDDQVHQLVQRDITAAAIVSGMTYDESMSVIDACASGDIKFLYVSPERLQSKRFIEHLISLPISLIAIDEAHCISQWGYDFRPSYLKIAAIREWLPRVPVIAVTASATRKVKDDIIEKLNMKQSVSFMTSFARPNLSYHVEQCDDKINRIIAITEKLSGSGIIYCKTRKKTKELSDALKQRGVVSDYYHAGLDQETRKEKQQLWQEGKIRIIVCTNAFGMGIDKADVQLVVHADIPDCIESYYQEAGRAGRDGKRAYAILLYRQQELDELRKLPNIKFPDITTIRKVYQALANYLQLPSGIGAGRYFDFDLDDFVQKFKMDVNEVVYSLQALKQEQIISYLEHVYMPSRVEFISGREGIEEFEYAYPELEPIIKALLRNYSGILDHSVRIKESNLAWILKRDLQTIYEQLELLNRANIIRYLPKKELPQLCYLQDRIPTEELQINYKHYLERKHEYIQRIEKMIGYSSSSLCRSVYIGQYFGDESIKPCGVCDTCSAKNNRKLDMKDFDEIMNKVLILLNLSSLTYQEILNRTGVEEIYLKEVIKMLKEEQLISIDSQGKIGKA